MEKVKLEAEAKTFVQAPRDRVYDAFATAKGLNAWFTKGAEFDAKPGELIRFRFQNWGAEHDINVTFPGRVIQAKRPERFVFEWGDDGMVHATTVEITFEERDGGTLVKVREYGFADTPEGMGSLIRNSEGWGEAVTLVKFYLEHGVVYDSARR